MAASTMAPAGRSFLDRPLARGLALLVFLGCVAALVWLERARLWPAEVAADDPAAVCIAERAAQIDGMLAEGLIQAGQAELFKTRAESMCRSTLEGETGGPALPGLPPR